MKRTPTRPGGIPIAPSLSPTLGREGVEPRPVGSRRRMLMMTGLALVLGPIVGCMAVALSKLIDLCTNLAFFGRFSVAEAHPADNTLGPWLLVIPVVGGLIVGLMARFGSVAIRGHGIPEAMERVLEHESKIPLRLTFLKPLSAAIAIGTGGPFGAEGPIIATGGALGSALGQFLPMTARERKTLLAAGAAAGMAATFGSPISAVLLAVELLLFELAPRSLVPVAFAAATGTIVGMLFRGPGAVFAMQPIAAPGAEAFALYIALGAVIGLASVLVTEAVYAIEHAFTKLPFHWMWWPALGAVAVGIAGLVVPRALGVGYDNIRDILGGAFAIGPLALLVTFKFFAWVIALGSGTSGGTLAPLFTFGGGLGALAGYGLAAAFPSAGIDPRICALVGMASMFAGASRALLASIVFAFETTRQPLGLVPLLGGACAAFLVSSLLMRHTIMTRKIAERGVRVPSEYGSDPLRLTTTQTLARMPVTMSSTLTAAEGLAELARTGLRAMPVIDAHGALLGIAGRKELGGAEGMVGALAAPAITIPEGALIETAVELMSEHDVGMLPVVAADGRMMGVLDRRDVLRALAAARGKLEVVGERRRIPAFWKLRT